MTTAARSHELRRRRAGRRVEPAVAIAAALRFWPSCCSRCPQAFGADVVQQLTALLIFVILAAMWNALAGYGGLVSVGQQAFIGFGAYVTILLAERGVAPYLAWSWRRSSVAGAGYRRCRCSCSGCAAASSRSACGWSPRRSRCSSSSTTTSAAAPASRCAALNVYDAAGPPAHSPTGWRSAFTVVLLGLLFVLLRSRTGAALQAIRDDEEAAASLGVRVDADQARCSSCWPASAAAPPARSSLANTLFIQPQSIFGVQWTAYMIFMVLVGGLGTLRRADPRRADLLRWSRPVRRRRAPGT